MTSIVLAVCVLLSCIAVGSFSATAGTADVAAAAQAEIEVEPALEVQPDSQTEDLSESGVMANTANLP